MNIGQESGSARNSGSALFIAAAGDEPEGGRPGGTVSTTSRTTPETLQRGCFTARYLQDALTDEAHLDMAVVGGELAPHGGRVAIAFAVQVLGT